MEPKELHLVYVPFTGLGLYNGFRGNDWLKNRIKIFKHFVLPSLLNQTDQNFTLWISWRPQERNNPLVQELKDYLDHLPLKYLFTYFGVCFWDDKYEDVAARDRLAASLKGSLGELFKLDTGYTHVYMTIQPSDDMYVSDAFEKIKAKKTEITGYRKGYIANYNTLETLEYNPKTIPPFFTIRFPKDVFFDPGKHMVYTGPYKSHEYAADTLKADWLDGRGFVVGTHGENISTVFDHPFNGEPVDGRILFNFGVSSPLHVQLNWQRRFMRKLPYKVRRKLRYWNQLIHKFYEKHF